MFPSTLKQSSALNMKNIYGMKLCCFHRVSLFLMGGAQLIIWAQ